MYISFVGEDFDPKVGISPVTALSMFPFIVLASFLSAITVANLDSWLGGFGFCDRLLERDRPLNQDRGG